MNKPLKDWTLGELKDFCISGVGAVRCAKGGCLFKPVCDYLCKASGQADKVLPGNWDLTEPHRWTEQDIEDARVIKMMLPWARYIRREDKEPEIVVRGERCITWIDSEMLPSLKCNETVMLDEILGGVE